MRDLEMHLDRKVPCDAGQHKCEGCGLGYKTKKSLQDHRKRCKGKSNALLAHEQALEIEQLKELVQNGQASSDNLVTTSEATPLAIDVISDPTSSSIDEPSQPPVDQPLTIIDWPDFFEFGNHKIRKTGENPQRVSVYDLIAAMTDDKNPRTTFMRLQTDYPENVAVCSFYKFSGRGNQTSPATDARGAVIIMNLLPGKHAAQFRVACADIIVRYLGGDETLIGEIQRNRVVQETAAETNPIHLFGEAVTPSVVFLETSPLQLQSVTNVIDFRSPSIYTRQVFDKVSNVHPVGRPQDAVSAEQLAACALVKIGSQGDHTNRQLTHVKNFDRSKLLDSKLTSSYTHVETQAKDIWKNNGELYEGLFEGKSTRDTELLLVRDQEDYERQLRFYHQLCPIENTPLELQLAQERSKQIDGEARKADAEARKAEAQANADARKAEAQANADARKAEAEADVRMAEAEARKAEADARKVEADIVFLKLKIAHGI